MALFLICTVAHAAQPHRYEVRSANRSTGFECVPVSTGQAPAALVAASDGARSYLESMRLGERSLEPVGDEVGARRRSEDSLRGLSRETAPCAKRGADRRAGDPPRSGATCSLRSATGCGVRRRRKPDVEVRFRLPPGSKFPCPGSAATASRRAAGFSGGARRLTTGRAWSPSEFLSSAMLTCPVPSLRVALLDAPRPRNRHEPEKWIENAARNVALLYGRFPVESLQVMVAPTPRGRGPVPWAYVSRGGGPRTSVHRPRPSPRGIRSRLEPDPRNVASFPAICRLARCLAVRGNADLSAECADGARRRDQRGRGLAANAWPDFSAARAPRPDLSLARASERIGSSGIICGCTGRARR